MRAALHDDNEASAGALVRDLLRRQRTMGNGWVATETLQASVEYIIDGMEWKLRGQHKHQSTAS